MPLKLLDYGRPKPFGETIGRPKALAWPVNVYRVTLPKASEDGDKMNPFERVILKLIDAGVSREADALAQETCLPKALVQCGLLRLQDQGYIDEYNQIIKQWRDRRAGDDHDPREFVTACVFRELTTGRILPHVQFMKDNPLKTKEQGKIEYQGIRWDGAHRNSPPTPLDVISALRGMNRRSISFGNECRLPSVQLVTIAEDAELYHLDCLISIQKSDGEFRIADPFGKGFSLVLESAFRQALERDGDLSKWFLGWKNAMIMPHRQKVDNQTERPREPFENDINEQRYPQLVANLRRYYDYDENSDAWIARPRSIMKIFSSIEWALFHCCSQRPCASPVQQLKLTTQSEHPSLLKRAAEELSLEWPAGGLFPVREGKLEDFLAGKAEMGTVLSLSLLMASDNPSHPLRLIAAAHQDFIVRLLKIKKARDESGHGNGRMRSHDVALPDEAFMREVVTALLPTVRFSDAPASGADKEAAADTLMNARTSIQSEFGFALFNRLGFNLQDRLIGAEQFWLSCSDGDDALAFTCDLYAALQSAFRRSLTGVLPPDIGDSEYVETAKKNAEACALGDLPECLLTVKRSAIRETLLGNDQTLQSCIVAFLLVSPAEALNAIALTQSSFIADLAHVIELRSHGNEPLPLSKNDIRSIRKSAYTTITALLEA